VVTRTNTKDHEISKPDSRKPAHSPTTTTLVHIDTTTRTYGSRDERAAAILLVQTLPSRTNTRTNVPTLVSYKYPHGCKLEHPSVYPTG
jgi:hypothetical protein